MPHSAPEPQARAHGLFPAKAALRPGLGLREERRARGLTQMQLSARSGVHKDHISGIETGRYRPRHPTIRKLLRGLELQWSEKARVFP